MKKQQNKKFWGKNSTPKPNSQEIKTLHKIFMNEGGTVSYIFEKDRLDKYSKPYKVTSFRHSAISKDMFFKFEDGKISKRKYEEVLEVLHDTKHDIGAVKFILD